MSAAVIVLFSAIFAAIGSEVIIRTLEPREPQTAIADFGEWRYFKVDQTRNDQVRSVRVIASACRGRFNLHVKNCHPGGAANCEEEEAWLPSLNTSNFKWDKAKSSVAQAPIREICTTNGFGLCRSDIVYFIGIHAIMDDTEANIELETYSETDTKPKIFEMDTRLSIDFDSGDVRWNDAVYCVKFLDPDGTGCEQNARVPGSRYQMYYSPLDTGNNMGSECGMKMYGTPVGKLDEDKRSKLEGIKKDTKYLVNILMTSEDMTIEYMANIVQFSQDIGGDPSEYNPEALSPSWIAAIVVLCGSAVMGVGVGIFLFAKSRVNRNMGLYQGIPDAPKAMDFM